MVKAISEGHRKNRPSFRNCSKGGGGGGRSHVSVGVRPQSLGGSGGMLPRNFLLFRLSEMASGAFSSTLFENRH